jgi:excisionase family DNA binding protein
VWFDLPKGSTNTVTDTEDQRITALRREMVGDLEDLLSYDEVCAVLCMSRYTLSRMVAAGTFASIRLGRRHYISQAAVSAYIAQRNEEAEARRAARSGAA